MAGEKSQFALTEHQRAIRDMARGFAAEEIAPHAIEWDQRKHFPADVIRRSASLGMGGICVREDIGGSGLARMEATLIFEALAEACPSTSAFLSIHNMVASMVDRHGDERQRREVGPLLCSAEWLRQLLPDRAGLRVRRRCTQDARRAGRRRLCARRGQAVHLRARARATSIWSWPARASPGRAASRLS